MWAPFYYSMMPLGQTRAVTSTTINSEQSLHTAGYATSRDGQRELSSQLHPAHDQWIRDRSRNTGTLSPKSRLDYLVGIDLSSSTAHV
jgi:hypothetical protein